MLKELLLTSLTAGGAGLESTFKAVPDDKVNWKPLDNGRTALDAFASATQFAGVGAKVLETRGEYQVSSELFGELAAERANWTKEIALEQFAVNSAALIAQIEAMTDEELSTPITMPLRGGTSMPFAGWVMFVYRAYISRFAQINYIQTLYGDNEFH